MSQGWNFNAFQIVRSNEHFTVTCSVFFSKWFLPIVKNSVEVDGAPGGFLTLAAAAVSGRGCVRLALPWSLAVDGTPGGPGSLWLLCQSLRFLVQENIFLSTLICLFDTESAFLFAHLHLRIFCVGYNSLILLDLMSDRFLVIFLIFQSPSPTSLCINIGYMLLTVLIVKPGAFFILT